VRSPAGTVALTQVDPGQPLVLWAGVHLPERDNTSWRAYVNGSIGGDPFTGGTGAWPAGGSRELITTQFQVPGDAEDNVTVGFVVVVESRNATDANATWERELRRAGTIDLDVIAPEVPPTRPPWGFIAAVLGIVLAGVAVGVYAKRRRPRQIRGEAPRSRSLQELEREDRQARGKRVQEAPAKAEAHPQLKILEARAADVRRIIELAQERKDRGELTEHQLKTIRDKKEAELQRIEEEMAGYREGSGTS
ncbi:MAG: hypothetical protein ACRDH5_14700, partial [bacterium]